jgi:hypothetical protein
MHAGADTFADEAKPGDSGVGGFRHRSLHIKVEDRFRAARASLGKSPPPRISLARYAAAHGLDRRVVLVGWPVALEIVEECRPVMFEAMFIKIAERERKSVVDADQCGRILGEAFHQPFGDATPRPVFFKRRCRRHFSRQRIALGQIDAQAF